MMFKNRAEAGEMLAEALHQWRGRNPLVVAIPRGAIVIGRIVAERLDGDLDVVLTRKLHAPWNPELAMGAVDETGWIWRAGYAQDSGVADRYLESQAQIELETIRKRRAQYTPACPPVEAVGRVVIVVDDGLATGSTMIAALHAMRAKRPARLICAVPVAAYDALERVRGYADEVVCLHTPDMLYAVGQHYRDFRQVDDDEVMTELRRATERSRAMRSPGGNAGRA